jgi:hypothetical protein
VTVSDQDDATVTPLPVGAAVDVPIFKLDCAADPDDVTVDDILNDAIPTGCQLVPGVEFDVTADGNDIEDPDDPFVTGDDGGFLITVEAGTDLVISEDVTTATPGYSPRENPIPLQDVDDGSGAVFVNVATIGKLDVIKIVCPVDIVGDAEILVSAPGDSRARIDDSCARGEGVDFTIDGDALDQPLHVTTDEHGKVLADLPAGDYRLAEDSAGVSDSFAIEAGTTTKILVTNFVQAPTPTPSPTPEPVTRLPNTGSGEPTGSAAAWWLLLVVLIVVAAVAWARSSTQRHGR